MHLKLLCASRDRHVFVCVCACVRLWRKRRIKSNAKSNKIKAIWFEMKTLIKYKNKEINVQAKLKKKTKQSDYIAKYGSSDWNMHLCIFFHLSKMII